jgi:hypothetical protein
MTMAKIATTTAAGSGKAHQRMRRQKVFSDLVLVFRSPESGCTLSTGRLQPLFGPGLPLVQPGYIFPDRTLEEGSRSSLDIFFSPSPKKSNGLSYYVAPSPPARR